MERDDDGAWIAILGDFVLRTAFQPIFRFDQGHLAPIACEALLRVSRDGHPVLTEAFFAMLDAPSFIAIEPELRRMHIRNASFIPSSQRRLFLNLDPRLAETPTRLHQALASLADELRAARIPPADIVCEFTEVETACEATLPHFAHELRARGFVIAIDDYGDRASRPERVEALAPDIVKFDGRLVKRLLATPAGIGTLRLMASRFASDGIHCVLEGLETMRDIERAETTGAQMLQGYALAEPRVAGPDFGAWIARFEPQPAQRRAETVG
ncbi:MAG: EAL domain-containing protein [Oricola sp.]|nr:EAL domain-containing protein [Oricola sp.]